MAKRNQAAVEAAQHTLTQEAPPPAAEPVKESAQVTLNHEGAAHSAETVRHPEAGQGPDESHASRLPEMRELKSINLGPDRDSPRLRLLRNYRFNQMQIRSDEQIPAAYHEPLKAEGWTERPEEGAWTKQLPRRSNSENGEEPKHAWPTVLDAERLFHDIANAIRADKKLPPLDQERGAGA